MERTSTTKGSRGGEPSGPAERPGSGLDTALLAAVAAIGSLVPLIGFIVTALGLWRTPGRLRLLFWGTAALAVGVSVYRLLSPVTTPEAFFAHALVLFLGANVIGAVWFFGPFGYLQRNRPYRMGPPAQ